LNFKKSRFLSRLRWQLIVALRRHSYPALISKLQFGLVCLTLVVSVLSLLSPHVKPLNIFTSTLLLQPISSTETLALILLALAIIAGRHNSSQHAVKVSLLMVIPVITIGLTGLFPFESRADIAQATLLTLTFCLAVLFLTRKHLPESLEIALFMACMAVSIFGLVHWAFSGYVRPDLSQVGNPLYPIWAAVACQIFAWVGVTQSKRFKKFLEGIEDSPSKKSSIQYLMGNPVMLIAFGITIQEIADRGLSSIRHVQASLLITMLSVGTMVAIFKYANYVARLEEEQKRKLKRSNDQLQNAVNQLLSERETISNINRKLDEELNLETNDLSEAVNALKAQRISTQAACEARSRFLSMVSHEIRGPLSAILTLSSIIKDSAPNETARLSERLQMATRHLNGLVSDILEMNKLEFGQVKLREKKFNLNDHVVRLAEWVGPLVREKGLYLRYNNDGAKDGWVIGDELRLRQILLNLINNAVKFTQTGGILITLSTKLRETDLTDIEIKVRDTGPGISPDRLQKIFEPFEQESEETAAKFGGFGLGLAIVKDLLQLMEGSIEVQSTEGQGSTFVVRLTLKSAIGPDDFSKENKTKGHGKEINQLLRNARILLVDDIEMNRDVAKWVLEAHGCQVFEAASGEAALEILEQTKVDLILMDLHMPGMNGIDTTRAIRENQEYKNVPIIGLSATDFEEEIEEWTKVGVQGHLTKPLDPRHLVDYLTQPHVHPCHLEYPQAK